MARAARLVASATIGSLIVIGAPMLALAQSQPAATPAVRTSATQGAILGTVKDDHGQPMANVVVSALGAITTIAVTDKKGRFEIGPLAPGPYLLRAHLAGYVGPHGVTVRVGASTEATSEITLARTESTPILAAGVGGGLSSTATEVPETVPLAASSGNPESATAVTDDHSETAWRVRHARRSVLKDVTIPADLMAGGDDQPSSGGFIPVELLGKAVQSPAHAATSFLADAALSG